MKKIICTVIMLLVFSFAGCYSNHQHPKISPTNSTLTPTLCPTLTPSPTTTPTALSESLIYTDDSGLWCMDKFGNLDLLANGNCSDVKISPQIEKDGGLIAYLRNGTDLCIFSLESNREIYNFKFPNAADIAWGDNMLFVWESWFSDTERRWTDIIYKIDLNGNVNPASICVKNGSYDDYGTYGEAITDICSYKGGAVALIQEYSQSSLKIFDFINNNSYMNSNTSYAPPNSYKGVDNYSAGVVLFSSSNDSLINAFDINTQEMTCINCDLSQITLSTNSSGQTICSGFNWFNQFIILDSSLTIKDEWNYNSIGRFSNTILNDYEEVLSKNDSDNKCYILKRDHLVKKLDIDIKEVSWLKWSR